MPIVATFFGIVIRMFYKEHEPPHFHAEYQGQQAKFSFDGEIIAGHIRSARARSLIRQWALSRRSQLQVNWKKIQEGQILDLIEPLE
jgi:hypothetical protein